MSIVSFVKMKTPSHGHHGFATQLAKYQFATMPFYCAHRKIWNTAVCNFFFYLYLLYKITQPAAQHNARQWLFIILFFYVSNRFINFLHHKLTTRF